MATKELSQPTIDPVSDILKWVLLVTAIVCFALLGWATVLTYRAGAAASASVHRPRRQRADDRRRHRRRQGRLPESRPDGLRQHLRNGVLFRRGLHRLDAGAARRAHQAKPRQFGRDTAGHQGAGQQVARDTGPAGTPPEPTTPAAGIARRGARRRRRHRDDAEAAPGDRSHSDDGRRCRTRSRRPFAACRPSSRPSSTPSTCRPAGFRPRASIRCCASKPPTSSSIPRSPRSRGGPIIRTRHGPRTGLMSRRSATRRRPTPSVGRGSASASPSSRWGSCCGSTGPISTIPTTRRWKAGLATYRALTPSQVKTGKYFIVVALVFLASQGAGAIMAHSYYERATFLRHPAQLHPAVQFPAELPPAGADHLDRPRAGSRAACSSPRRSPAAARQRARDCSSTSCSGSRCSSSRPR